MPITVRPAQRADVPAYTDVALGAFKNSGLSQELFPDESTRLRDWSALRHADAKILFEDPGRNFIVAVETRDDGSEEIVGCAEWIAPGGPDPNATEEQVQAKKARRSAIRPASMDLEVSRNYSATVNKLIKTSLESIGLPEGAEDGMWNLNNISVHVDHQGKGIGKKLVQWGIDRAVADRKDVYLVANENGAPLYRKMGFELIGQCVSYEGKPYQQTERAFIQRYKGD